MLRRARFVRFDEKRLIAARTPDGRRFGLDHRGRRDLDGSLGHSPGREIDEAVACTDELFVFGSRAPKGRACSDGALRTCHPFEDSLGASQGASSTIRDRGKQSFVCLQPSRIRRYPPIHRCDPR